jgi:hypothetical protein
MNFLQDSFTLATNMSKSGWSVSNISLKPKMSQVINAEPRVFVADTPHAYNSVSRIVSEGLDYERKLNPGMLGGCGNEGCPCGSQCTCGSNCTCAEVAEMEKCSVNSSLDVHLERVAATNTNGVSKAEKNIVTKDSLNIPRDALFVDK